MLAEIDRLLECFLAEFAGVDAGGLVVAFMLAERAEEGKGFVARVAVVDFFHVAVFFLVLTEGEAEVEAHAAVGADVFLFADVRFEFVAVEVGFVGVVGRASFVVALVRAFTRVPAKVAAVAGSEAEFLIADLTSVRHFTWKI